LLSTSCDPRHSVGVDNVLAFTSRPSNIDGLVRWILDWDGVNHANDDEGVNHESLSLGASSLASTRRRFFRNIIHYSRRNGGQQELVKDAVYRLVTERLPPTVTRRWKPAEQTKRRGACCSIFRFIHLEMDGERQLLPYGECRLAGTAVSLQPDRRVGKNSINLKGGGPNQK
jgi:hypothetical protein